MLIAMLRVMIVISRTGMIVDRTLIPDLMVITGSSGSLQMVDHILIDVPLTNVYLDSTYYKGHCKVMCVNSPSTPYDNWKHEMYMPDVARPRLES